MPNRNVRIRWVSRRQLDVLWEFLNSHRDIATAYNRSLQAKEYSKRKWREISEVLNAQGDGAHKEWNEWSKYWVDYKAKLKKRASALRSAQSATGGGPSTEQPLTEIETKFLQILGQDFGQGLSGVRVEPFPENSRSTLSVDDPLSESNLMREPLMVFPVLATQEAPLQEPQVEESLQHPGAEATANSTSRSSASTPPLLAPAPALAARSPQRRRRRRREPPMSQEAARRALVESSRLRAEATVRSSQALENIMNTLQRIERIIQDAFPRAGE